MDGFGWRELHSWSNSGPAGQVTLRVCLPSPHVMLSTTGRQGLHWKIKYQRKDDKLTLFCPLYNFNYRYLWDYYEIINKPFTLYTLGLQKYRIQALKEQYSFDDIFIPLPFFTHSICMTLLQSFGPKVIHFVYRHKIRIHASCHKTGTYKLQINDL